MSYYDDSPIPFVPHRDIPLFDESIRPYSGYIIPPPPPAPVEEGRGRSRSRSRSPRRLSPVRVYGRSRSRHRSRTRSRSHSRSSSIRWRRCAARRRRSDSFFTDNLRSRPLRSRSLSPIPAPIICPPQPSQPPIVVVPQAPMSPPSPSPWYVGPPSVIWPAQMPKQPVDILTFHYNKNMAYAPAAKTYEVRPLSLHVCV
jgi:hypothetical protein